MLSRHVTIPKGGYSCLRSHALAYTHKLAPTLAKDKIIICNLSGRGDKDLLTVAKLDGIEVVSCPESQVVSKSAKQTSHSFILPQIPICVIR